MQKETTIANLFGKSIYKCTINNYDEYNKPLIKDIESFVKENDQLDFGKYHALLIGINEYKPR